MCQFDNTLLALWFSVSLIYFFRIVSYFLILRNYSPSPFHVLQIIYLSFVSSFITILLALITSTVHLPVFPIHSLNWQPHHVCYLVHISPFRLLSVPSSFSSCFIFWDSSIFRCLLVTSTDHNIWKSIKVQGLHWNTALPDIPNRILQGLQAISRSAEPASPHNLFIFFWTWIAF